MSGTEDRWQAHWELLLDMHKRMAKLENLVTTALENRETSVWMSAKEFCAETKIELESLKYAVRKGKVHGDALRNVGTAKRAVLRYHKIKTLDQYLNRAPVPTK